MCEHMINSVYQTYECITLFIRGGYTKKTENNPTRPTRCNIASI